MSALRPEQFPRFERSVRGKWAPIFLSPIIGSPERFIIGVVAVDAQNFYVERANALSRLECLYGSAAETAVFAAEVALDDLEADCSQRGAEALADPMPSFSGVSVGDSCEGEAESLSNIAQIWMASLSSLYTPDDSANIAKEVEVDSVQISDAQRGERLPSLVFNYVRSQRPEFGKFFDERIQGKQRRRKRSEVHKAVSDFSGSRVVASFGTLKPTNRGPSVDRIKRRMFDLLVIREEERKSAFRRRYEMIVQRPTKDDPQITKQQASVLEETIDGLSDQAHVEDIALHSMASVPEIGQHILSAEAA